MSLNLISRSIRTHFVIFCGVTSELLVGLLENNHGYIMELIRFSDINNNLKVTAILLKILRVTLTPV